MFDIMKKRVLQVPARYRKKKPSSRMIKKDKCIYTDI